MQNILFSVMNANSLTLLCRLTFYYIYFTTLLKLISFKLQMKVNTVNGLMKVKQRNYPNLHFQAFQL